MPSERHARLRALFDEALDLPEDAREAFVRAGAGDDRALADEVITLLGIEPQQRLGTQGPWQMLAEVASAPLQSGRRLGRYELFECIGSGGMGQVYRARRVDDTAQPVAVKIIRPEWATPDVLARFRAERQMLARLSHPGIAHFIDADTDADGTAFVAMELVDGVPLLEHAAQHDLDLRARVTLFRQLLAAVRHAHGQLVIHRDIKAANVMVRRDGVVKLLDFGIGKLLDATESATRTRDRMFTPVSAAPEQIRGEPCDVTTDVYALGVLLYELLAGVPIFDTADNTPGAYERLVLDVPPSPMRVRMQTGRHRFEVPRDLEAIVQKALRKERHLRYASAEQFDADLDRFLANEPVSVSGSGHAYRIRKFVARHRVASAFGVVSALAVLVALAMTIQQNREIRAERDRANVSLRMMKDAFMGADPAGLGGGDVTARQVLGQTAHSLQPIAASDRGHFQDLAEVVMDVQLSMGLVQDASELANMLGPEPGVESARWCLLTARVQAEQRSFVNAEKRLSECPVPEELSADDRQLFRLIAGRIAIGRKQFDDAARHFAMLAASLAPNDPQWVLAQQQRSHALANTGNLADALAQLDAASSVAAAVLPEDHPTRARLQLARLEAMSIAGDRAQLLEHGPAVLAPLAEKYGADSALLGRGESVLGLAFVREKRYEEAVPHLDASWRAFRSSLGERHALTLRTEMNLALAMAATQAEPEAVMPRFEHLVASSNGPEHQEFRAFVRMQYAQWLAKAGRGHEARDMLLAMFAERDEPDAPIQADETDWLNHAYWSSDCGPSHVDEATPEAACRHAAPENAACSAARRLLCHEPVATQTNAANPSLKPQGVTIP